MKLDWRALVLQISRRMWFRASLHVVFAAAIALAGSLLHGVIPKSAIPDISASSIGQLLGILASSMLVVTTFSVSTVVTAYASATSNATPRASSLLVEDGGVQRSLAGFIGAFAFSMVGLIALSLGIYDAGGRLILLGATALVIVAVIVVLLRWIDNVSRIGEVRETIARAERATHRAMVSAAASPALHGAVYGEPPHDALVLRSGHVGYVTYIDMQKLNTLARKYDVHVWAKVLAGDFVTADSEIARVSHPLDDEAASQLKAALVIQHNRSFEQDPRFGLIVLAEMAQRALSPAVNDPGTAIDVLSALTRLLCDWAAARKESAHAEVRYERVHIPELDEADFFDQVYAPLARDGAPMMEVIFSLQKSLATLGQVDYAVFSKHAARHVRRALIHSDDKILIDEDRARLHRVAQWHEQHL